ncbi:unnamed protein product [Caenorhabditis angaria]|uniref:Neurotransmitter-gated ion-channel ligand-binding domain-containing protein n=1 Tax=Caenorhabditis angaria TaxID=860376 RepID=A0A9P1N2H3_9PELO|nr:unnamed protein product [Caenorhabditis angaria]
MIFSAENEPLYVSVHWNLKHVSIDEKRGTMKISGKLLMKWIDKSIIWNPAENNNTKEFQCFRCNIWKPEITFLNSADKLLRKDRTRFKIISNWNSSSIILMETIIHRNFGCFFDFTDFPYDQNECTISIKPANFLSKFYFYIGGSSSNSDFIWGKDEIRILGNFKIQNIVQSQWFFNSWQEYKNSTIQNNPTENEKMFSMHQTKIIFKRNFPIYFAVIKQPLILFSILNLLSFFLPTMRSIIFLLISNILIQFIFLKITIKEVPISTSIPNCILFLGTSLIFNTISLFFHIFLFHMKYRNVSKIRPILAVILFVIYLTCLISFV